MRGDSDASQLQVDIAPRQADGLFASEWNEKQESDKIALGLGFGFDRGPHGAELVERWDMVARRCASRFFLAIERGASVSLDELLFDAPTQESIESAKDEISLAF